MWRDFGGIFNILRKFFIVFYRFFYKFKRFSCYFLPRKKIPDGISVEFHRNCGPFSTKIPKIVKNNLLKFRRISSRNFRGIPVEFSLNSHENFFPFKISGGISENFPRNSVYFPRTFQQEILKIKKKFNWKFQIFFFISLKFRGISVIFF